MADAAQGVAIDTASSLIRELRKAFLELKAYKDASENNIQWKDIEEHFLNMETTFKRKTEELEAKEKEYEEKESETRLMIMEREAAVVAKEQDLLDHIQELKDAAVSTIAETRSKYKPAEDNSPYKESKVSSSQGDDTNEFFEDQNTLYKMGENGVKGEVKPRPELMHFCEQMDAKGLLNFIMENGKNVSAIREELAVAFEKSATESAQLVLNSLDGFYPPAEHYTDTALVEGTRRSCVVLLEAMAAFLTKADAHDHILNPQIKQKAKATADDWKPKLFAVDENGIIINSDSSSNGSNFSLEAEAFLRLLATFRIASECDEEELCKLVLAVAHIRQASELCRSLGLIHKIPGIIEALVSGGKQIDAVHFIHAFQLNESFPPVPLLKTYLKDLRRNSQGKGGNSGGAAGAQNDANTQELTALRAVIRCVEDYKLEAQYPLDSLHKRVVQLDKSKSDKKRHVEFGKSQPPPKKARANGGPFRNSSGGGGGGGRRGGGGGSRHAPPNFNERATSYTGFAESYPHAVPNTYTYQIPSQPASFGQQNGDQRLYYYPQQDNRVNATSYSAAPPNYGNYMGSASQPSQQPYM